MAHPGSAHHPAADSRSRTRKGHPPHGHPRHGSGGSMPGMPKDFDKAPFLVIWETTQACDLACKHCRAEARPDRHPEELTTDEAKQLLTDIRRFGPIIFVFSGGDALKRPDIAELTRFGSDLGLRMAITPATTPLATERRLRELHEAGMARLAVSLDGSSADVHDDFRRVRGSFDHGLRILETARDIGMSTQVNTVVARHNVDDFEVMARLLDDLGIVFWEVFFLVPVGRAGPGDVVGADAFEGVFNELYDLSKEVSFDIKATAAPHYNRVVLQRKKEERRRGLRDEASDVFTDKLSRSLSDGLGRARGVNDGDGFLFVSHTGELFPSGFLPLAGGNVRSDDIVDVYRDAPLFKSLRDKTLLKGKCGICEYRKLCGGSRARAYAVTGDPLEAEPYCAYRPPRWERAMAARDAGSPLPMVGR